MEIMNDSEIAELEKLNENAVLIGALKKIFLSEIYKNGTMSKEELPDFTRNFAFSLQFDENGREYARTNEDLGKALRACNEALRMVSIGFNKLFKYKKVVNIDVSQPAKHR